jgi:hypothetical protein
VSTDRVPYDYAVLRVVPRVERAECMNAAVLLYCSRRDFLDVGVQLDVDRLAVLDPVADVEGIRGALRAVEDVCAGADDAGAAGAEPIGRRFRWLTAPRSTVLQPGPVHTGLTADPRADLDRLVRLLVAPLH